MTNAATSALAISSERANGKAASSIASEIKQAEARVDTKPTVSQRESGNYTKGHLNYRGLNVAIENPRGSKRRGLDKDGQEWSVTMPATYGYVKGTEGRDGDHVDVYIGPDHDSNRVWIIDQVDAETGKFDEHKCMLGFGSRVAAIEAYKKAFSDGKGAARMGAVTGMSFDRFKTWVKSGETKQPVGKIKAYAEGGVVSPYEVASGFRGQREGAENAMLNDFLNNGGRGLTSDQYAWCSRFVKQAAQKANYNVGGADDMARSWLNVGEPVKEPSAGDVVVLSRGDPRSGKGHVGFFEGLNPDGSVRLLSGNHNDAVASAAYPADRVLGYRRLTPADGSAPAAAEVSADASATSASSPAEVATPDDDDFGLSSTPKNSVASLLSEASKSFMSSGEGPAPRLPAAPPLRGGSGNGLRLSEDAMPYKTAMDITQSPEPLAGKKEDRGLFADGGTVGETINDYVRGLPKNRAGSNVKDWLENDPAKTQMTATPWNPELPQDNSIKRSYRDKYETLTGNALDKLTGADEKRLSPEMDRIRHHGEDVLALNPVTGPYVYGAEMGYDLTQGDYEGFFGKAISALGANYIGKKIGGLLEKGDMYQKFPTMSWAMQRPWSDGHSPGLKWKLKHQSNSYDPKNFAEIERRASPQANVGHFDDWPADKIDDIARQISVEQLRGDTRRIARSLIGEDELAASRAWAAKELGKSTDDFTSKSVRAFQAEKRTKKSEIDNLKSMIDETTDIDSLYVTRNAMQRDMMGLREGNPRIPHIEDMLDIIEGRIRTLSSGSAQGIAAPGGYAKSIPNDPRGLNIDEIDILQTAKRRPGDYLHSVGAAAAGVGANAVNDEPEGFAFGGTPSFSQFSHGVLHNGPLKSDVPGRTDHLPISVKSGAYVIPADIVSGMGQGNSEAGHKILADMFASGPYGIKLPSAKRGKLSGAKARKTSFRKRAFADGGAVPIMAAGGEYVVDPETVTEIGDGDIERGHDILDAFVNKTRQGIISELKQLPPPAR